MQIPNFDVAKAVTFMTTLMYVPANKLFIESTKPTGTKHYISSANCLAATALRSHNKSISDGCIAQIKSLKSSLGKVIETYWYATFHPKIISEIPSIVYKELGTTETSWTTLNGHEVVCNNSSSGTINCASEPFANRAMLHALVKIKNYYKGVDADLGIAQACFSRALTYWDGKGFNDEVGPVHYDSYKTGLGLYCLNFPELKAISDSHANPLNLRSDLCTVIQNSTTGGVYGRYEYNATNNTFFVQDTFENTESTSLFLLAAECG